MFIHSKINVHELREKSNASETGECSVALFCISIPVSLSSKVIFHQ